MKVLGPLGLGPRLRRLAFSPPAIANRQWDTGEMTFELPLGDTAESTYGAPYLLLHRGDLHRALVGLIPGRVVRRRCRVIGLEPAGDGVHLCFDDGRRAYADVVIGADGTHSVVREALYRADATFTGRVAYRAVFPRELVAGPTPGPSTKWWGPDRHIVIYYVSAGRELYFTTSVPDERWTLESWSAKGRTDELQGAFAGFHPEVTGVLDACPSVHKWAIYDRDPLPRWHTDKQLVLIGDACHPMTPYMAQGAATAMEDAVSLLVASQNGARAAWQKPFPATKLAAGLARARSRRDRGPTTGFANQRTLPGSTAMTRGRFRCRQNGSQGRGRRIRRDEPGAPRSHRTARAGG